MRKLLLILAPVTLLTFGFACTTFALINEIVESECSSDQSSDVATNQLPPDIRPGDDVGPDSNVARPIKAVFGGGNSTFDEFGNLIEPGAAFGQTPNTFTGGDPDFLDGPAEDGDGPDDWAECGSNIP